MRDDQKIAMYTIPMKQKIIRFGKQSLLVFSFLFAFSSFAQTTTTVFPLTINTPTVTPNSITVSITNNTSTRYILYISVKNGSGVEVSHTYSVGETAPTETYRETFPHAGEPVLLPDMNYTLTYEAWDRSVNQPISGVHPDFTATQITKTALKGGTQVTPEPKTPGQPTTPSPKKPTQQTTPTPKDNSVSDGLGLDNPTGVTSIEDFVAKALNVVVDIGTPLVAFFLILSGFMFVAARGNEEKLQTAKRSLVYTLIGAALILGCWGIAQAIKGTVEDVTKPTAIFIEPTIHNEKNI
jgi:hypothetical protein